MAFRPDAESSVVSDDPSRLQKLARRQARQRMLDIRQRAEDFDQARREANAAAALLDLEGGSASLSGSAAIALSQAEQKMAEAGPGDTVDKKSFSSFGALAGGKMDLDKQTGLKDCPSSFINSGGRLSSDLRLQWTPMNSTSRIRRCYKIGK